MIISEKTLNGHKVPFEAIVDINKAYHNALNQFYFWYDMGMNDYAQKWVNISRDLVPNTMCIEEVNKLQARLNTQIYKGDLFAFAVSFN